MVSCDLVSFDYEEMNCNIGVEDRYFNGNKVVFSMSGSFDEDQVKDALDFLEGNMAIKADVTVEGDEFSFFPDKGWKLGKNYTVKVNGYIQIGNQKRLFQLERQFIYGKEEGEFLVVSTTDFKSNNDLNEPLNVIFNKEVDYNSFCSSFSINPSTEYKVGLSNDGKTVSIIPKGGWKINERYRVNIENCISIDGYYIKPLEFIFCAGEEHEVPELKYVCPMVSFGDSYQFETNLSLDGYIEKMEPIGFVFSKAMDFDSVKKNIKFSPSVSGHFLNLDSDYERFVFVPDENYELNTKYRITVNDKISDLYGNQLNEASEIAFTSSGNYLKITGIKIFNEDIDLNVPNSKTIECKRENSLGLMSLSIAFSSDISNEGKTEICDCIDMEVLFPLSARTPVKRSIVWTDDCHVILDFNNLSISTDQDPVYYQIMISGGEKGIKSNLGDFMEDSICFVVEPK